jgi:hypothetical protein
MDEKRTYRMMLSRDKGETWELFGPAWVRMDIETAERELQRLTVAHKELYLKVELEPFADFKVATAAKKPPMAMIPLRSLVGTARVLKYGAKAYKAGNWINAKMGDDPGERYFSGLLRHLTHLQNPDGTFDDGALEDLDPESGLPQIDHMICGLIILRGILIKEGVLPEDPGEGNEPPRVADG